MKIGVSKTFMISGLIIMVAYLYLVISNQPLWSIPFTLILVVIFIKRLILKHSGLQNNSRYTLIADILLGFIIIVIYAVFSQVLEPLKF